MFIEPKVEANRVLRPLRNQRGQSLVELGMTVGIFALLVMGTLEIGRIWLIGNMITQAAREGARVAALTPMAQRGTGGSLGIINSTAKNTIITLVKNEIRGVLDQAGTNALTVAVTQSPSAGGVVTSPTIPTVTVSVTGSVNYIFGLLGSTVAVNRSVSFRDEGR